MHNVFVCPIWLPFPEQMYVRSGPTWQPQLLRVGLPIDSWLHVSCHSSAPCCVRQPPDQRNATCGKRCTLHAADWG